MDRGEQVPGWEDSRIAEVFGMGMRSLENWPSRSTISEAGVIARAEERTSWSLSLLASRLME